MLKEFGVRNLLSFRDRVTLSFEATEDKTFEEWQVVEVASGVRLLRFAMIYGANASGKTNVPEAVNFLCRFWFAKKDDIDKSTQVVPYLLDKETPEQPSEFEMKFYVGDKEYVYFVQLDRRKVLLETLRCCGGESSTELFARRWEQGKSVITVNQAVAKLNKSVLGELSLRCLPNMSFFAARSQVNCALPMIDEAKDRMSKNFLPTVRPKTTMSGYAERGMLNDERLKRHMLDFVRRADSSIVGIDTKEERMQMPVSLRNAIESNEAIPNTDKEKLLENPSFSKLRTGLVHVVNNGRGEERHVLPQEMQSEGTCRGIGLEAVVNDLIIKDSVWFVDKGKDGHSDLYSLSEFKGVDGLSSIMDSYQKGVFGAIPDIKN